MDASETIELITWWILLMTIGNGLSIIGILGLGGAFDRP